MPGRNTLVMANCYIRLWSYIESHVILKRSLGIQTQQQQPNFYGQSNCIMLCLVHTFGRLL